MFKRRSEINSLEEVEGLYPDNSPEERRAMRKGNLRFAFYTLAPCLVAGALSGGYALWDSQTRVNVKPIGRVDVNRDGIEDAVILTDKSTMDVYYGWIDGRSVDANDISDFAIRMRGGFDTRTYRINLGRKTYAGYIIGDEMTFFDDFLFAYHSDPTLNRIQKSLSAAIRTSKDIFTDFDSDGKLDCIDTGFISSGRATMVKGFKDTVHYDSENRPVNIRFLDKSKNNIYYMATIEYDVFNSENDV